MNNFAEFSTSVDVSPAARQGDTGGGALPTMDSTEADSASAGRAEGERVSLDQEEEVRGEGPDKGSGEEGSEDALEKSTTVIA